MSFGLPPGSFKDVKDEASALEAVRQMADKLLTAGVSFVPTEEKPATKVVEKPVAKADDKPADKTVGGTVPNAEIEALRAELAEVKGLLTTQAQQTQAQKQAVLKSKIEARMNSWASPKYGVAGQRNYKQTRAAQEFQETLLPNLLAGRQASGLPIDQTIEVYMEQLRVHDDENYKPAKRDATKDTTLGTPGASKGAPGADAPKNIHSALMRNAS
jgi:hypothetical protein